MPVAVGAPAVVIGALLAVLFMLAWPSWRTVIVNSLSISLPVVGNVISNLVADGLDAVYEVIALVLDAVIFPAVNFVIGPIATIENAFDAIKGTLDTFAGSFVELLAFKLPDDFAAGIAAILGQAQEIINFVQSQGYTSYKDFEDLSDQTAIAIQGAQTDADEYAFGLFSQAEAAAAGAVTDADQIANLATSAASAAVAAGLADVDGLINTAYSQATAYAGQLFTTAERDIAGALSTAEAFASTAVAGVVGLSVTDIENDLTSALAGIYTDVDAAVTGAVGAITTGDEGILAGLKDIPLALPTTIAGLGVLAGATTLTLARYLEECGIPNCQNLGQYGRDLQDLLALVGDASMVGFLVELIHHPDRASQTIDDAFGTVISDTLDTGKTLLGVG
jgi:hypothetical protein